MPRVCPKNPVALLMVISAQAMYGNVEFLIEKSQGGIAGCRLCRNAIELNGCVISTRLLSRMNIFRSALSSVLRGNSCMLPEEAMSVSEAAFDEHLKVDGEHPSTLDGHQ